MTMATTGLVSSIIRWLRAGYPDGVPPKDFYPLLALLRNTLNREEFEEVIGFLEEQDSDKVRVRDIWFAIEHVTSDVPTDENMRAVAAKLAAGGWPLSNRARGLAEGEETEETVQEDQQEGQERPGFIRRVIEWVRAGYPEGVPSTDYVPLFALLRRRIGDEDARRVADELIAEESGEGRTLSRVDAQVIATKILGELPTDDDIRRVEARLAEIGWELV